MNKKHYTAPCTEHISIELETAFMSKASVFGPEGGNDEGLTIEEHGFANPDADWEGQYTEWDN